MNYVNITADQGTDVGETFNYSYSAVTQKQLEKITKKYQPVTCTETKMDKLKKLDASVTRLGTVVSLIVGIMGTLIMGSGMSLCLVASGIWFIPGIVIGIVGMAIAATAYPIYTAITKKQKEEKAPIILALAEEIAKEQ